MRQAPRSPCLAPTSLAMVLAAVLSGHGGRAHADAIPPPEPMACGLGQEARTDHGGTHCEYRRCASDAVCPVGMACVAREERHCDPRGEPCWTGTVGRCAKADRALPVPRCPPGATADAKRTGQVLAKLRSHEDGKRLVGELGRELVVCYGDIREGSVQDDGVVVLQRDRPAPANAARLGHLLLHLVNRPPLDLVAVRDGSRSCRELVRIAEELEQQAHRYESLLRKEFGLPALPFEDLTGEYARRCQALRSKRPR